MRLFSSIKNLFTCKSCACQEQRVYTEKEVAELREYWIGLIKTARIEERKECEKIATLQRLAAITINSRPFQLASKPVVIETKKPDKSKRVRGSGSIIDYDRIKRNSDCRNSANAERMVKGIEDFVYNCCEFTDKETDTDAFLDVYKWWCTRKNFDMYETKLGIGKYLRKMGILCVARNRKNKKVLIYSGIRIRCDILKLYSEEKKKPHVTHNVKVGSAANVMKAGQDGELFSL
jgi:hypothetical protein